VPPPCASAAVSVSLRLPHGAWQGGQHWCWALQPLAGRFVCVLRCSACRTLLAPACQRVRAFTNCAAGYSYSVQQHCPLLWQTCAALFCTAIQN